MPFLINHSYYDIRDLVQNLYNNSWKSVEVINTTSTDFGAIFYSQPDYAGKGYIYPGNNSYMASDDNIGSSKFNSIYFFNRKPNGSVNAYLYKTLHYQEKDEDNKNATCEGFSPVTHTIDSPQSLGKCSEKVQSIKVYRGLAILIQNAGNTSPYNFTKAEVFTSNDPDITDNYIGQCGGRSLLHWFRYVSKPCATHFMILPIQNQYER